MTEPVRWMQTNLRETDAALDPVRHDEQLADMRANVVLMGMGGICAYYPTRVLDIGCGSGRFLRGLRNAGWDVAGLELNDEIAAGTGRAAGLAVATDIAAFADQSFDLITITHVLEHVRDPEMMLKHCARMLRPGGVIAVAVPNLASWQAKLTREHWFNLDLPRHLWHFSEARLVADLLAYGLAIAEVRRDPALAVARTVNGTPVLALAVGAGASRLVQVSAGVGLLAGGAQRATGVT